MERMAAGKALRAALVAVWALAGAPLAAELPGDWRDETALNPAGLEGTGAEFGELPRAPAASDGAGHWVAAWTWLQPPPDTALQRVCVSWSADDGASWTAPVLLDEGAQFLPVFSSYAPDFPAVASGSLHMLLAGRRAHLNGRIVSGGAWHLTRRHSRAGSGG